MVWTKRWRKRMRALMRRGDVERELDEELAFHLQMETEKNLRAGMSPAEARRQAVLKFGGWRGTRRRCGTRAGWLAFTGSRAGRAAGRATRTSEGRD